MATTGVAAAISSCTCSSAPARTSLRRVDPNAASCARLKVMCLACSKNSMSFGFDPGHPPSM
jgi:hypothetical protein